MSDNTYTGGAYSLKGTVDPVNDYWLVQNGSTYYTMNRNTLMGTTGTPIDTTSTQTISGSKTLSAATLSGPVLSGTVTGTYTLGGTPTFPSSVATLTGTQTLTNKTLTSPTINSPNITNATLTADSIAGYTTSNSGNIYGIAVTTGVITGSAVIGSAALATNAVQANQLATNAITLGYAQITSNLTTTSTTAVQATGLTTTVTIPSGNRKIKITAYCNIYSNTNVKTATVTLWSGAVNSGGTVLQFSSYVLSNENNSFTFITQAIITPSAGSVTYNVGWASDPGGSVTMTMSAGTTYPAFILVEAI